MKVLFAGRYNESENLSGPEKVAKRIFQQFTSEENSVFAEYFFDGRKYSLFKKLFGSEEVLKINDSEVCRFGIFKMLISLFKLKPEVIHIINYERFAVVCFLYKIFSNVRIIYNVHGIISFENKNLNDAGKLYELKDKICETIYLKYSDKLIFLSERSLALCNNYTTINNDKVEFIPNGIDEAFHDCGENKLINFNEPLSIVFAGDESRKEKGFEFFIRSLSETEIKLNVYLIGRYNHPFSLKNDNFNFYVIDRMDTKKFALFLKNKDVFISASSYEQFSITATEAMAAGLIPIVTAETGMSSYIKNSINGFIINYGDSVKLNDCLVKINSERNLLLNVSGNARKIFSELSWDIVFKRYRTIYE
ncbi:MAG TPA: glycosyltransferase family 4 protein [Ignavibacteria bacterium]|nr:glycosyltransferase family 4 protein [Ignavibacteria bacterium]